MVPLVTHADDPIVQIDRGGRADDAFGQYGEGPDALRNGKRIREEIEPAFLPVLQLLKLFAEGVFADKIALRFGES